MHGSHTGHEPGFSEGSVLQHVERIFFMSEARLPSRVDGEVLVVVKKPHLLQRNPHRLRRHPAKIVGPEPFPPWFSGKIQRCRVNQALRLEPNPLSPVEANPGQPELCGTAAWRDPLTFMQRMPVRVRRQKAPAVGPVEHQMATWFADRPPARGSKIRDEPQIAGKDNVTGALEGGNDGRVPHSLIWPEPNTMNLVEVSSSNPIGPRA